MKPQTRQSEKTTPGDLIRAALEAARHDLGALQPCPATDRPDKPGDSAVYWTTENRKTIRKIDAALEAMRKQSRTKTGRRSG